MKVILLQDVKKIGNKGDVINVADGYGRNYLLPRKLAMEATGKNLQTLKVQKNKQEAEKEREISKAKKIAEELAKKPILIKTKAGEKGRLFGSVTSMEIASALEAQTKLKIDKRKIDLPEPIKTLGKHTVKIKLHPKVHSEFNIIVEA